MAASIAMIACGGCRTVEVGVVFDPQEAKFINEKGAGRIEGQAFLRQNGGGVVTAAGNTVYLIPATKYARERFAKIYNGQHVTYLGAKVENTPPEYMALTRTTIADAQGNFTFEALKDGDYIVQTQVFWRVAGSALPEGGSLYAELQVRGGKAPRAILAGQ
jgi:hypothetical protein